MIEGNNSAGYARFFALLKEHLRGVVEGPVIVVSAVEALNLQTLLRRVLAECLNSAVEEETQTLKVAAIVRR